MAAEGSLNDCGFDRDCGNWITLNSIYEKYVQNIVGIEKGQCRKNWGVYLDDLSSMIQRAL